MEQTDSPAKVASNDQLGPLPFPRWPEYGRERVYSDAYSAEQMLEYAEHAVARERQRTMFSRRPGLWALKARESLELIAAPQRPDGSWNRDREECRRIAAEALGRYDEE